MIADVSQVFMRSLPICWKAGEPSWFVEKWAVINALRELKAGVKVR